MERLDLTTPNFTDENIQKLSELFPNCVTESGDGKVIDFDALKQELSSNIVEGNKERYQLSWPGKAESLVTANTPINKNLRPNRKESKDFDNTENLYIEGDNLEVLKLLQETYLGKIKMIYIDPPYNTGKDFVYKDNFTQDKAEYDEESGNIDDKGGRLVTNPDSNGRYHSDWLSMMYPRLKLARNLLKEDGVIFISIDENEETNLKKILDEVFGEDNLITSVIWKNRYNAAKEKHLAKIHEHIYFYSKNKSLIKDIYVPGTKEYVDRYFKNKDENLGLRGPYRLQPLEAGRSMDVRNNLMFSIPAPDGTSIKPKRQWKWGESRVLSALESNELEFNKTDSGWSVSTKQYLKDENGIKYGVKPFSIIDGIYGQNGTKEIGELFGSAKFFPFPKPSKLLSHLLMISDVKNNDIILDFFSGSATTAHAVMQLNAEDGGNRKFIMAQIPELTDEKSEACKAGYKTIAEIGQERIRRAGEKIKEDNAEKEGIDDLDIGFRVLKVDSSNMKDVYFSPDNTSQDDMFDLASNIKDDRTDEDLLFMVLLDWGIDLSVKIECREVAGKTVYFADDNFLAACFEENLDEGFIKELVVQQPRKVVLRDSGFASSSVKINVEQIFKQADIEVKVI